MEVFGLGLKIKEEGAATVEASIKRLGAELAKTVISVTAVSKALTLFVRETADAQREQAQLATVLRSTNGISGQTIETLNAQADALVRVTAFTGGAISEAQALLLTFTNVREVFADATRVTLDLSQALGMDARSAAMMLGKALNDPVLGVTALRRAGVQLSESQTNLIKQLVAVGQIADAQRIILKELETQVGGSAAAYRNTLGGAIDALKESFNSLFEANQKTGTSLAGTINALATMVTTLKGPVQFVFTSFTNGLVVIASLIAQVGLAITRFFSAVGAAAVTFLGAFGVLLPVVGDNIGKFIDDLNAKVAENDEYFASLQKRLREWRNEVVMGTTETQKLGAALGGISGETGGGGGAGMAALPAMGGAISAFEARAAQQFTMVGGKLKTVVQAGIPAVSSIVLSEAAKAAALLQLQIQQTFQTSVGNSLVGGIVGGIEQAIASGNIGDGFKALTSMLLAGIGDAMIKFGTSTAAFSQFMAKIQAALITLNPAAGLAASLALIGVGAALKGAARGMFGGQGGGAAGSISSFGGNLGGFASNLPTQQIIFGQTSATTAAGMTPRQSVNVTVIGPNDPSAQRSIQELITKANSRGRIG